MKVLYSIVLASALLACNKTQSTQSSEQAPDDVETAYLGLSAEVQQEMLGTQAIPVAEVRKELLAKADKDGDGKLSEDERAALRAEWKTMKEQIRAALLAKLDSDKDGSVSPEEKQSGLDNLGQKVKEAIAAKNDEIRAAQEAARADIKEACAKEQAEAALKEGNDNKKEECQAAIQAGKDEVNKLRAEALDKLHAELEDLKAKLQDIEGALAKPDDAT